MAAPTLLLLPGLLCNARVWRHVIAALGSSVRIVTPTLHDCDDIAAQAARVAQQVDEEHFYVAGFSYGGYIALELLHQLPARLSGVALISSQARTDSDTTRERRLGQIATAEVCGDVLPVLRAQLPLLLHPHHLPSHERLESMLAAAVRHGTAAHDHEHATGRYSACWDAIVMALEVGVAGFVTQQRSIMSRHDRRETLARAAARGVPLLLASSVHDALIPRAVAADMAKHVKGAAHVCSIKEHAGHMLPLEQPQLVAAALRTWLATPPRAAPHPL